MVDRETCLMVLSHLFESRGLPVSHLVRLTLPGYGTFSEG